MSDKDGDCISQVLLASHTAPRMVAHRHGHLGQLPDQLCSLPPPPGKIDVIQSISMSEMFEIQSIETSWVYTYTLGIIFRKTGNRTL